MTVAVPECETAPLRDMDSAPTKCISKGEMEGSRWTGDIPNTVSCNDCIIHFADIYTVGSESKEKELEDSQPFIHGVKLHGPKGEIVRLNGVFNDRAMINAMDSRVFERIERRLGKVTPSDRLLWMVDGTIVPSAGRWSGTIKVCRIRRNGTFEIFLSGGSWALLFGKPLMKTFSMEHHYMDDTISLPGTEKELRMDTKFSQTRDCGTAAAAGVSLTANIKQCETLGEKHVLPMKQIFSRLRRTKKTTAQGTVPCNKNTPRQTPGT